MRARRLLFGILVLGLAWPVHGEEEDDEDTSIEIGDGTVPEEEDALSELLGSYDRRGGGNTIPIEREILRLRQAGETAALLRHINHHRFGGTVVWALSDSDDVAVRDAVLAAFEGWPKDRQRFAALDLAAFGGERVRGVLRSLDADQVRGARLRAGDEDVRAGIERDLKSDDAATICAALLAAAEARDCSFLAAAARFAKDERPLPEPIRSRFRRDNRYPDWSTLGEIAIEAANRMVRPTTPDMIAWWYEPEKGPRFGWPPEAHAKLAAFVEAGAVEAQAAVTAVLRTLRGSRSVTVEEVKRGGRWSVRCTVDGATLTARVGADGVVTIPQAVPCGGAPEIDGQLRDDEWDDARRIDLGEGIELRLKHDENWVHIAIRSTQPGPAIAHVAVRSGTVTRVLHASASLGTAVYEADGDRWRLESGFAWQCREGRSTADDRTAHLKSAGWLANTVGMGTPGVSEFRIARRLVTGDAVRIAVAYWAMRGAGVTTWPRGLTDDAGNRRLLQGATPDTLRFETSRWATLELVAAE